MKKFYTLLLVGSLILAGSAHGAPSADELWTKLQTLRRSGPAKQQVSSVEERNTIILEFLGNVEKASDEFIHEFPNDKRIPEAKLLKLEVNAQRPDFNGQPIVPAQFESLTKEIVDSPDSSKPVKVEASFVMLSIRAQALIAKPEPDKLPDFEKEISAFTATYPNDPANRQIPILRLNVYEKNDPTKAKEILKTMVDDKTNPRLAMEAQRKLKAEEVQTKPLELKFTTIDGAEFDITKWRGKVVLVDFWATWCGPCKMEVPHVVEAYKKLHAQGFEIIGISLDSDKEKLLAFTKDKEMTWPQYFDGKGWENKISSSLGINSIPAMWLVDKKGMVRSLEARGGLEEQISKLLKE